MMMTLDGQRVQPERYQLIPRTLIFLMRGDEILLIQIAQDRGAWAGLYNGVGGHIEAGENPYAAATRELQEETGIIPDDLRYCGVIVVNTGSSPGIGIHIFVGTTDRTNLEASEEGQPRWIALDQVHELPLVADLPIIIPRAVRAFREAQPFCGITTFDDSGMPNLEVLP